MQQLAEAFPERHMDYEAMRAAQDKRTSDRRLTKQSRGTGVGGGESPESAAHVARVRVIAWNHDRRVLLGIQDPIARARYYISSALCPTPWRMQAGSLLHYLRAHEGFTNDQLADQREAILAALSRPTPHPIANRVA